MEVQPLQAPSSTYEGTAELSKIEPVCGYFKCRKSERVICPLHPGEKDVVDLKVIPFADIAAISDDAVDPVPGFTTGARLRELSHEAIDLFLATAPAPVSAFEALHWAGQARGRVL